MSDPQFEAMQKGYDNSGYSAAPPSGRGCFFYGCLLAAILMLIGVILTGTTLYIGYAYISKLVDEYTTTTPDTLPSAKMSDEDRKALKERFEAFGKAADEGKPDEIVLDSDQINALIENNPHLKGKVFITLKDDSVNARLNWPLEGLPLPRAKGRYLVGSGTLKVSITNGQLDVRAQKVEVNGKPLPAEFMSSFSNQNLAAKSNEDAEQSAKFKKIETLVVKNGKVRLKTKAKDAQDEAEEQKRVEAEEKKKDDTPKAPDAEKKNEPEPPAKPKAGDAPAKSAA